MAKNHRIEKWLQDCEVPAPVRRLKRRPSDGSHVTTTPHKRRMVDNNMRPTPHAQNSDKNSRGSKITTRRRHSLANPGEYDRRRHEYRERRYSSAPAPNRRPIDISALTSQIPAPTFGYDYNNDYNTKIQADHGDSLPVYNSPHDLAQPKPQTPTAPSIHSIHSDEMPKSSQASSRSDFIDQSSCSSVKRPRSADDSNTTKKSKYTGLSTRKLRALMEQLPVDHEGFAIPGSATLHFSQPQITLRIIPDRIHEAIRYFSSNNLIVSCIPETLKVLTYSPKSPLYLLNF